MKHRVVLTFGTRPEAIKMAPVYLALKEIRTVEPLILLTGQHREQLLQALEVFRITPDHNLDVMTDQQTLPDLAGKIIPSVAHMLKKLDAHYVLVHGDTLTTFAAAWASFLCHIPVGHVEAGLRSGSFDEPFPEEGNRVLCDRISDLLFAPTEQAANNLRKEGLDKNRIHITGQTGVDAILTAAAQGAWPNAVPQDRPIVTVTLHRRENWPLLPKLGEAVAKLAHDFPQLQFVCPLHLNPVVRQALVPSLQNLPNVTLLDPLPYGEMARLMQHSILLLTDSGGLQEEGASLGVPVAIARNVTERPEGLNGALALVSNNDQTLYAKVAELLNDEKRRLKMASSANPYGDGRAAQRVASILCAQLEKQNAR